MFIHVLIAIIAFFLSLCGIIVLAAGIANTFHRESPVHTSDAQAVELPERSQTGAPADNFERESGLHPQVGFCETGGADTSKDSRQQTGSSKYGLDSERFKSAAGKELAFLRSLLPPDEQSK
jgi:hypothetical protein